MAYASVTIEPAGKADTGIVDQTRELPGAGVLFDAEKDFFLACPGNGSEKVATCSAEFALCNPRRPPA